MTTTCLDDPSPPALRVRSPERASGRIVYVRAHEEPNGMNAPALSLDREFVAAGLPQSHLHRFKLLNAFARGLGRYRVARQLVRIPGRAYLVVYCWGNDSKGFPFYLWREVIPWIYDCWPRDYHKWNALFRRHRTRLAFFSAKGSAEYFQKRRPEMTCIWIPEACSPEDYRPARPLSERSIHVLELGRKHSPFHSAVVPHLGRSGWKHMYSKDGTRTMLFEGQDELIRALGDTAISVCFPRSITHPEASGGLETVTLRYFESIASGCLILGRAPAELVELFGYNPVIELDVEDAWGQVSALLGDLPSQQSLVDRNLRRLMEVGTYGSRAREILRVLRERGWEVDPAAHCEAARTPP
jgi:hypothetical protein